jgi:outer membrane protein OmpA-like peptidoglycan-associated protein
MRLRLLVLTFLCSFTALAQRHYGVATSNWGGTNSIYLNPANVADSRHRFTIDLFSFNLGVDNDKGILGSPSSFNIDNIDIPKLLQFEPLTQKFNLSAPYAEVRGPGFMWSIDKKSGVAFTTRVRLYNQLQDFNRDLYGIIIDQTYRSISQNYPINTGRFNWNLHAWTEMGLTYGRVLVDKGEHMVKGGATVRYLGGVSYANLQANELDAYYYSIPDSIHIYSTDAHFSSSFIKTEDDVSNTLSGSDIASNFFSGKRGVGFGLDLGLVYEWRPDNETYKYDMDGVKGISDNSVNRYKLRFSAAITDLGSIRYKKENKSAYIRGSGSIISGDFTENTDNFSEFKAYMQSRGLQVDTFNTTTKVKMPTALQLSVDYSIGYNLYANLAFNGNIISRFVPGNTYYSQLTLTPRYDRRSLSFGLPITYNFFSNALKLGAGIRLGGFFIGSDDMLVFLGNKKQTGANVYFGASVPFNKRRPKDSDKDAVSNRQDNCKHEPGLWENKGCPVRDKDGDNVPDSLDKCPDVAGLFITQGCPDTDLDSVADAADQCPNLPGPVSLNGCPDRDHDGVSDKTDDCPDVSGLASMQGCPDTDGDGLADNKDACPAKAGSIENNGCPDTDSDGITDDKDRCPTVRGTIANNGCPEIREEVKKRLAFAATAIQFETGKAIIKPASFKLLNDIVKILNEYSDYSMRIEGHTDNVGKPDKNLSLSSDRATSVKAYFVGKGIEDVRLFTNGFGDTKPAATNKTTAGRAKNRRVEMSLFLPENRK